MNTIFDLLLVFGVVLFMLAISFIRQQMKALLRQEYMAAQAEELEAEQNSAENDGHEITLYKRISSV